MITFIKKQKTLFTLLLFISLAVSASVVLIAFILQSIVDSALQQDWSAFQDIAIKTAFFLVVFGCIYYLYGVTAAKFVQKITIIVRQFIVDSLTQKTIQQYSEQNTSHYLSMITNDIKQVEDNYIKPLINIIQSVIMFVLSLVALFYLNVAVTLVLLACVVIMFIAPSLLASVLEKKQNAVSKRMSAFTNHTKDFLEGFDVLFSYRVLRQAKKHFTRENEETAQTRFDADHVNAVNNSLSNVLGVVAQFAVILVSAYLIIKGQLTGGALIALVQLSGSIVSPLVSIFAELPKMKSVKSIVNRILELKHELQAEPAVEQQAIETPQQIELKNIQFSYDESQKKALQDINATIKMGKKYAIIGESGCGKSTLVKLIAGQLQHTEGELLLDGNKQANKDDLVALSAMVSQKVFLFDTTMKQNIALYESFTEQDWKYALENSGINKFVNQLESGIEGLVGEGGSALSGGQRQRVAIARALIRNKSIVILDEGTSALDIQTSYEVESSLLDQSNLTLLTITHQINEKLLRQYDGIIYMEAGRIAESGTYDELMQREGRFKSFTTVVDKKQEFVASA